MTGKRMGALRHAILVPVIAALCSTGNAPAADDDAGLRIATFDMDVTPPIGGLLAYDPVVGQWELGLRARGLVLLGAGEMGRQGGFAGLCYPFRREWIRPNGLRE